eukprot:gene14381-16786_t
MASAISAQSPMQGMIQRATVDALVKLDPRKLAGNPVILTTEIVAVLATLSTVVDAGSHRPAAFAGQIAGWLRAA